LPLPLEVDFSTQNTVPDPFWVWVTLWMLCWSQSNKGYICKSVVYIFGGIHNFYGIAWGRTSDGCRKIGRLPHCNNRCGSHNKLIFQSSAHQPPLVRLRSAARTLSLAPRATRRWRLPPVAIGPAAEPMAAPARGGAPVGRWRKHLLVALEERDATARPEWRARW
jgi:hypothetical protein